MRSDLKAGITIAGCGLGVAIVIVVALKAFQATPTIKAEPPAVAPPAAIAPTPAPEVSPAAKALAAPTMKAALAVAQPLMHDAMGVDDPGMLLFAAWSMGHMKWSDVGVARDETSFALVQKDSDEARGKRLCASGSIIEIATVKTDFGKSFEGLLMTDSVNLYHFLAVRSSGSLVEHSPARICGVITGKYDYSNSGGGTGHAVQIVGVFDLPENKK